MAVSRPIPHALASEGSVFDGFAGGIVRKPRNRPAGLIHAVVPRDQTACGLRLETLNVFAALSFEQSEYTRRCRGCADALRRTSVLPHRPRAT